MHNMRRTMINKRELLIRYAIFQSTAILSILMFTIIKN